MNALIANALNGRPVGNVNFLPHLPKNSEVNEFINSIDIDLSGMSGAEGWNLPSFNATCLGKWSLVNDSDFLAALEIAESRAKTPNTEGEGMRDKFTYSKTIDSIIEKINE